MTGIKPTTYVGPMICIISKRKRRDLDNTSDISKKLKIGSPIIIDQDEQSAVEYKCQIRQPVFIRQVSD